MSEYNYYKTAREWAQAKLQILTRTSSSEVDFLLTAITGANKQEIISRIQKKEQLTNDQLETFQDAINRRATGEPLVYILEKCFFWKYDFYINNNCFIPRKETISIVEAALTQFNNTDDLKVLDLGTGTGIIAICLAKQRPNWDIIATDVCNKALDVAKYNAKNLGANNISAYHQSNLMQNLNEKNAFDMIVCNPPYVKEDADSLKSHSLKFEPKHALVGGKTGVELSLEIIKNTPQQLKPKGFLILETAKTHSPHIKQAIKTAGLNYIATKKDHAGLDRTIICQKPA